MPEDKSDNLSKPAASFILGIIIIIIVAGGVYLFGYQSKETNQNVSKGGSNENVVASDIDTTNWILMPFFSDRINFYAYFPNDWSSLYITEPKHLVEGSPMIWLGNNDLFEGATTSMSVSYYNDTGLDLETWVGLKTEEIKRSRAVTEVEKEDLLNNNQPMIRICVNGSVSGSASPGCFTYLHVSSYILELRTEGAAAENYHAIKKYSLAFDSKFYVIDGDFGQWTDYVSNNAGFQIKYPANRYVKEATGGDFINSFMFKDGEKFNQLLVHVTPGYSKGVADFWYESAKLMGRGEVDVPIQIYIQGRECLLNVGANQDSMEVICKNNEKLYDMRVSTASVTEYDYLFKMLSSLQFIDNKYDGTHYLFKDTRASFQFVYPDSFALMDNMAFEYSEDMIKNSGYVGFSEYEYDKILDEPPTRSFSVNYYKTDQSVMGCVQQLGCFIYGYDLSGFVDSTFLGLPAKIQSLKQDYGSQPVVQTIIFKQGDYIFMISIGRADQGDNKEVDDILASFKFIN